jgi:hypothetical protein
VADLRGDSGYYGALSVRIFTPGDRTLDLCQSDSLVDSGASTGPAIEGARGVLSSASAVLSTVQLARNLFRAFDLSTAPL